MNSDKLGLRKNGDIKANRLRSNSDGPFIKKEDNINNHNRQRALSDGTLKLQVRQIKKENKIKEVSNFITRVGIDNIPECWKRIIERYLESGDSYQILIPIGLVNKFFNYQVKLFFAQFLMQHYEADRERFVFLSVMIK